MPRSHTFDLNAASLVDLMTVEGLTLETADAILPIALFGVPAALWQLIRHRSPAQGVRALAAWMLAALAPYALTRPWG